MRATYGSDEARLLSFAKEVLTFEGPRALAPGAPVTLRVPREGASELTIEGRSLGARKASADAALFEIRARLVSVRREDRSWLEQALGRPPA